MDLLRTLLALIVTAFSGFLVTGDVPDGWETAVRDAVLASTATELPQVIPQGSEYTVAVTTPVRVRATVPAYEGEGWVEPRYDLDPLPGIENARCGDWWQMAVDVGWPVEWLPKFDDILWRESRCQAEVKSSTNDYGLMQLNWAAHGARLTDKGITRGMLYDPRTNLTEGLWIAEYARDNYGCWSQPWKWSGERC